MATRLNGMHSPWQQKQGGNRERLASALALALRRHSGNTNRHRLQTRGWDWGKGPH